MKSDVELRESLRSAFQSTSGEITAGQAEVTLRTVVVRSEGSTESEQYLKRLCDHSFLSLWSYPGVFRDQGRIDGKGDGKEVCDLLVIFENHVLIFSDKDCEFFDSANVEREWSRWYKKAVLKSAHQVWGAERWIKNFPTRLFLDKQCKVPFPISLPDPATAVFHRVVVAHGASRRCAERMGGSGSLMIDSTVTGDAHFQHPFTIGRIDPDNGYVHVFDDTTLDVVMQSLDTISDFVAYLSKKEKLMTGEMKVLATGEEELLARYFRKLNKNGEHDFLFPSSLDAVFQDEGGWEHFLKSPERAAQVQANAVSYMWDDLIEHFNGHLMGGTQLWSTSPEISEQEKTFRWLARESRTRRRMLSKALGSLIADTPAAGLRQMRTVKPSRPGDPYYVFLLLPRLPEVAETEYRELRGKLLGAYCQVAKFVFPDARHIIGIATEPGNVKNRSEDIVHLDATEWTAEMNEEARRLQRDLGLFTDVKVSVGKEKEYPINHETRSGTRSYLSRNATCYCGSGKRFKRCHGEGLVGKKKRKWPLA